MTSYTGSDGLTYDFTDTILTVSGTGNSYSASMGVLTLSDNSTVDYSSVTKMVFEDGVAQINGMIGREMGHLTEVDFGNTVTAITDASFYVSALTGTVRIPATVTYMGINAFSGSSNITGIIFEGQPTTMGIGAIRTSGQTLTIYSTGWANATTMATALGGNTAVITYVTGIPTAYYGLKIGGNKVQVDSAVRDGQGNKIDSTYATQTTVNGKMDANTVFATINGTSVKSNTSFTLSKTDLSNTNVGSANSGKVLSVDTDGTITYVTAGTGSVTDVQVNGTSVMDGTVAKITMPTFDTTNKVITESD